MTFMMFSFKDGKYIGTNPILDFHAEEERLRSGPPTFQEAWQEWSSCGLKMVNRETQTFSDPTIEECLAVTKHAFRALAWKKDDSVAWFERRRKCVFDPKSTPWRPRPEYVGLLEKQGRLPPVDESGGKMRQAATALDARDLMEDALNAANQKPRSSDTA
eukprot:CAMPEP_0174851108 /NCGR_PEP_ID=MMETSP1114-20130205/21658_1 /TAXON_ID=312471 /ORGANISM="Neobodo designis, Strain CCAP 1951/1" /LENGTH=159 /DNA_ID=CAMNT_0016085617 /DNA_START=30 /DNA_END=505 /DNA_ORIENTATION=-